MIWAICDADSGNWVVWDAGLEVGIWDITGYRFWELGHIVNHYVGKKCPHSYATYAPPPN